MKRLALIWVIIAATIATVTTILQLEPAATFIETFSSGGSYYVMIPVGLTFLICILPLFPIMIINNFIQNRKNKMPADLTGMTGIVVKRETELTNAALMYNVFVNGEVRSKVGMGKSIFVELAPGTHTLQIKLGKRMYSPELSVQVESEKIMAYQTKTDIGKSLTTLVPKGEMLFLVQVPFNP